MEVTNAWISENGGLAQGTVDRVLSGHHGDLRISTMQGITKALVGGTWGQYPCPLSAEEIEHFGELSNALDEKTQEVGRLHAEIESLRENHHTEVDRVEALQQSKVDYLKTTVDELKHSNRIYRATVIAMSLIMAAVVLIDACLRNFGWIRW